MRRPKVSTRIWRLRVNNGGTRLPRVAFQHAEVAARGVVAPFPGAISSPAPKVVIDDAPRRQIIGDKAPGTTGAQDIEDRTDDLPFGIGCRPTTWFGGRDQGCENLPLAVIKIGGVGFSGLHTALLSQQINPIPTFFDTL